MPRFYFDLRSGPSCSPDKFGDEFERFEDARQHAQAILAQLLKEDLPKNEEWSLTCELRNEGSDIVYRCILSISEEVLKEPKLTA